MDFKQLVRQLRNLSQKRLESWPKSWPAHLPQEWSAQVRKMRDTQYLVPLVDANWPNWTRPLLTVTGNFLSPFTAGMGFQVLNCSSEKIEVKLADWLRNQSQNAEVHVAAIQALAEFTCQLHWQMSLGEPGECHHRLIKMNSRFFKPAQGILKAALLQSPEAIHENLNGLRHHGQHQAALIVQVYDSHGVMVGEIESEWQLEMTAKLRPIGSGNDAASSTDDQGGATVNEAVNKKEGQV